MDLILYNRTLIRPSHKLNSIVLQIYRENLTQYTPEHISNYLGCTLDMVVQGLGYMKIRNVSSLNEPLVHGDTQESLELIDLIEAEEEQDTLFQVEVLKDLSSIEQGVIEMLIDHYSVGDIMRHYKITKYVLNDILKKIVSSCGYDYTSVLNRKEGWLMDLDQFDLDDGEERASAQLRWVSLEQVLPNPNNPRMDLNVNTKHLQGLIDSIGWEEPLTCYESGNNFIIISGHRRWNAAMQLKQTKVPVYIVEAPKSEAEELDRIGSVQGGQVEWSLYDQVKYTYDMWIAFGKKSFEDLGNEMGVSKGLIGSRIRVYQYYPRSEIEDKLNNRMYSITMLDYIRTWIKRLVKHHPDLVKSLGEHYIRRLMLKKYEARCFNSQIAQDYKFVTNSTVQSIREFLIDVNKKLEDCQVQLTRTRDIKINSFTIISEIRGLQANTKEEANILLLELENLLMYIDQKKDQLENNS